MKDNRAFVIAIWVAVIGFLGTVLQSFNESRISVRQEDRRLQSELIIRAVETDKPAQALKNLQFLLDTGLIDAKDSLVTKIVQTGKITANFASAETPPEKVTSLSEQLSTLEKPVVELTSEQRELIKSLTERLQQALIASKKSQP